MAVDQHGLVQHRRILAESSGPVSVAEDRHRMRTQELIVSQTEDAAQRRSDAERLEVVPRDQFAGGAFGLPLRADAEWNGVPGEETGKDVVLLAQILVHNVGE